MVSVDFNGCKMATARQSLYQYDYEQQLQINGLALPEVFQADFCNAGDASTVSMLGENDVVDIPAQFIADGRDILAYVFYYDEATGGKTRAEITITVMARPERTDEQPTPEQESIIDQAIDALNEGVERAEDAADAAEEATRHYPRIANGYWQVWDAEAHTWINTGVKAVGEDGYSPTVTVTDIPGGHRVTITDETGPHSFDVMDGQGGGSSAVQSVNGKTGVVTLNASDVGALPSTDTLDDIPDGSTYKRPTGAQLQQISTNTEAITTKQPKITASGLLKGDGQGGVSAATPGTDFVPPSDYDPDSKTAAMTQPVGRDTSGKLWTAPGGGGGVTDVQVAGTSIVQGGVANVPMASASTPGVVISGTVTVTGTTPTITAQAGVRYVCGEVSTLDITLPASGIVDVTFESGTTATVLTITPPTGVTLKWANGFDPTALDANTTYEINIMDGLGVAASWTT